MPNPTGNPYEVNKATLAKMHEANELKGLQVKAELDKLGEPPRAFCDYLSQETTEAVVDRMEDCEALGEAKRPTIDERFKKIEMARPAVHPVTISLARKLKNLQED